MNDRKIVLVGEMMVDVTLQTPKNCTKVRMGGVFHAARAAWALGINYDIAYLSPSYLDREIPDMAIKHGAARSVKIGDISGCPNVMLIAEATEAGAQGYEHILSEHGEYSLNENNLLELCTSDVDILILSGNFDLGCVLSILSKTTARIHVDIGNGPSNFSTISRLGRPLSTLFLSTSARIFPELAKELPHSIQSLVDKLAERVILKENRGGARLFTSLGVLTVGSQRREIAHSVGVGDCFDAVFLSYATAGEVAALSYASWIAAEYASTTFPDDFRKGVQRIVKISPEMIADLPSVALPWEKRPACNIYIAAPDFDYIDQRPIDALADCLRYHNFTPRLPVREAGQANRDMQPSEKRKLFDADMALLEKCGLLIAVNINDDPGTLIEIGLAYAKNIPVIIYDPFNRAENVMLVNTPELVSSSLDEVITKTFDIIAKK